MKFRWSVSITTKPREARDPDVSRSPWFLRYAIVGLAVVGVASLIVWRTLGGG